MVEVDEIEIHDSSLKRVGCRNVVELKTVQLTQ
jgi:hypothetical protein